MQGEHINTGNNITWFTPEHKPVISLKKARSILGSSGKGISDDDLMRTIKYMEQVANSLLDEFSVPQNGKEC